MEWMTVLTLIIAVAFATQIGFLMGRSSRPGRRSASRRNRAPASRPQSLPAVAGHQSDLRKALLS
jgi:hypothetical protein